MWDKRWRIHRYPLDKSCPKRAQSAAIPKILPIYYEIIYDIDIKNMFIVQKIYMEYEIYEKSTSTDICDKTNFKRMRLSRYFSPIYERIAIFIEKWYRKIPHSSFNFLHSPHWKTTIPKYR